VGLLARHGIPALLLALLVCVSRPLAAQDSTAWSALDGILQQASIAAQADVEFIVVHAGQEVYRKRTESFKSPERIPIASAGKWFTVAAILTLVDDGTLTLDDPVSLWEPSFTGAKASITLRQLLSHTSGLGGDLPCVFDPATPLGQCVQRIAERPLLHPPGAAFFYTDASLHVAAHVAEAATGLPWNTFFAQRLAGPLGMTETTFPRPELQANPQVAAGAVSTAEDYLRFLRMIRGRGVLDGVRVLSRRMIDLMLADQTTGVPIRGTLYSAQEPFRTGASLNRYGLGNWLEGMGDAFPDLNSSQGSFGVSPFLDASRDLLFLAFLRDANGTFPPFYYQIQDLLAAAIPVRELGQPPAVVRETTSDVAMGALVWWQYIPTACMPAEAQCPLLVALPPAAADPAPFARASGLLTLAQQRQWMLALPELPLHSDAAPAMLRAMVGSLSAASGVDRERIYLSGFADAAPVAARIACVDAPSFAGLALMAPADDGSRVLANCHPTTELAAFMLNPAEGVASDGEPVEDLPSFWRTRNRCAWSREWLPQQPNGFAFQDAYGCWPGAAVRVLRSSPLPPAATDTAVRLMAGFLSAHSRTPVSAGRLVATSAASYVRRVSAPGALVSLFGLDLAGALVAAAGAALPAELDGVRVAVRDSRGVSADASLILVSPQQVNLALPTALAPGIASLVVQRQGEATHRDWLRVDAQAPALFAASADGMGPPAGEVLYVFPDGTREWEWLSVTDPQQPGAPPQPRLIRLGQPDVEVYVTLYGTGWRFAAEDTPPKALLGGLPVTPVYSGPQGQFAGLDQLNLRLDQHALPAGPTRIQVQVGSALSPALDLLLVMDGPKN
jgi:uncharacterized protein (TIGR03437 family)